MKYTLGTFVVQSATFSHANTHSHCRATGNIVEVKNALTVLPLLVPGLLYHHTVDLECIDENGAAGDIRILLCNMSSCVPIISATVNMPMTEIV